MPHDASLIATIATAFGLAMIFGFIAVKLRMPPLAGYLVAGIALGPHTRGFVADVALAGQLADIGVMLLMFGVGLHFSINDLLEVRGLALPGAIIQMLLATAFGTGTAMLWGWSFGSALLLGLSLSVASTVVLLRALEARNHLTSFDGHIAVGWLIVQDVVMVLVLVLLPPLAGPLGGTVAQAAAGRGVWTAIGITVAEVAAFVILMLVVGRRVLPRLLWIVAKTGSRELFTLCVIAAAVGVAFGSAHLFGVSFALGAFFAGMMMRESALSHRAAQETLPLQDAFAVLFFVSVGMLFDPMVLVEQPLAVLAATAIVTIATPLVAIAIVLLFRYPLSTALTVGAGLAQIGEFSFILAGLGVTLGLLSPEGYSLVLAAALISIAMNPLIFAASEPIQKWARKRFPPRRDPLAELPMSVDSAEVTGHVLMVGYGRVGRRIATALSEKGISYVIIEQNREFVERLREQNIHAVSGNGSEPEVLIQGHVARARMLVIATPETVHVRKMVEIARMLNPRIDIVVRTHSDEEADLLRRDNVGEVFMGEHELAAGMTRHVLARFAEAGERP
jgi:monovalent cation:H+ antiporter-2, CPA2 family